MNNAIAYRGHQVGGGNRFQRTTTTTTTTTTTMGPQNYNTGGPQGLFANANRGQYNNFNNAGGVQFSSKAQMLMTMMRMMHSLMSGNFGQLMNMMNGMNGQQMPGQMQNGGFQHQVPGGMPSFGSGRRGVRGPRRNNAAGALARAGANMPAMAPGQVKELKAGQTAKGANGSVVRWGQDGTVDVAYRDKDGQQKSLKVKDGMISLDGGKPQKLGNVGQLLKLPNGDVVGIGNNPSGPQGKKMVRVVMADNADKISTHPDKATNIYDIASMNRKSTGYKGGGINISMSAGSFSTPNGTASFGHFSMSQFLGTPFTQIHPGPQSMSFSRSV